MLVSNIETFLKKKKKKNANMVVKDKKIFWRMRIKKFFYDARNKDYLSIKHFLGKYKTFVYGGI